MQKRSKSGANPVPIIRASELNSYEYCHRSWWLRVVAGVEPPPDAQARLAVAHSNADSAGMVTVLMRQQITFMRAMAGVELRLLLDRAGIGRVDVRPLIELIEAARVDLARRTAPYALPIS